MRILFSMVSVNILETDQIKLLVESAKKYFLTNHEITFIVFTDASNTPYISDVKFVKINTDINKNITYYQFQKILSLNYINLNFYDYIFVHDIDQVYVGPVLDTDLLTNDFCVPQHFININAKGMVNNCSNVIDIDSNELQFTMGNFWGGPTHLIKLLLEYSTKFWIIHKNENFNNTGFFSLHSEEVMLIKFIDYYRIKEKRISSSLDFKIPAFLSTITNDGNVHNDLNNFKLIHDTKINLDWSKELFLKSTKIHYN